MIWPDGNWAYSNFDNLNRVTKVCENGNLGCASGLLITYTLDPLSRRDAIARPNSTASDFDYDLASRLTLLTQNVSGTSNDLSRGFTYNLAGQLKTRVNATAAHWLAATPGSSAYAANGRNQYTTVAGATFGYDGNGNLTSTGTRTYGYDAENRLTSVSGSASLTLTYDPLGRLRQTTAGGATTDFLYEGDRLVAEYNGSTLLRRYAHGPRVDEPIVWYEGASLATKRWLHPDERGSIAAWSDAGGAATVYRYGPYGEPGGGDFSGARFRYTGQIALPEVGLYHYKARAYDPGIGRFLQTDTVGYQDDFNLYTYVGNDPLNRADPTGECPWCLGAILGGTIELGSQLLTSEGRQAYTLAGAALARGDLHGALNAAGANVTRVAISAAAGAVGQFGAGRVANIAATAARTQASIRAAEVTAVATNVAGNTAIGAATGAGAQAAANALTGENGSIAAAALGGGAGGALGSLVSQAGRGGAQMVSDATGNFIGTPGGQVAAPLANQGAKEAALEVAGTAAATTLEKNISCRANRNNC